MDDSTTTEVYMILHDGTPVQKSLYESVRLLVEDVLDVLIPGVGYTTEQLCGEDFWKPLDEVKRRLAGKCLANLVMTGQIPLQIQGCKHQYPRKYMKI